MALKKYVTNFDRTRFKYKLVIRYFKAWQTALLLEIKEAAIAKVVVTWMLQIFKIFYKYLTHECWSNQIYIFCNGVLLDQELIRHTNSFTLFVLDNFLTYLHQVFQ